MRRIFTKSTFEQQIGYARAVIDDHYVHVSGTTGYDYSKMEIAADPASQAQQCIHNVESVLTDAGVPMSAVVRVHYIAASRADFEACWEVFRSAFGDHPPAATMWVAQLYDPAMKIEVEVTAALATRSRFQDRARARSPRVPSVISRQSKRPRRWLRRS